MISSLYRLALRIKCSFFCLTLSLLAIPGLVNADTITPESGWWWNPDQNGRGFSIEIQDNVIFLAAYTYDAEQTDGINKATWFVASGVLTGDDQFSGQLLAVENGQCFGCDAKTPTNEVAHDISILFTSRTTAELQVDGEDISLQRFNFAPSFNNREQKLMGQWSIISNMMDEASSVYSDVLAEMLVFDEIYESDGTTYIAGCRVSRTTIAYCTDEDREDNWALATYRDELDQYVIVSKQPVLYYRAYWMTMDSNVGRGWVDQYSSVASADYDDSVWFRAYRSASKSFVDGDDGPAKPGAQAFNTNAAQVYTPSKHSRAAKRVLSKAEKALVREEVVNDLMRERENYQFLRQK